MAFNRSVAGTFNPESFFVHNLGTLTRQYCDNDPHGSYGTVCTYTVPGRPSGVAVKIQLAQGSFDRWADSIKREAKLASRMGDRGIGPRVYDSFFYANPNGATGHFLVMEKFDSDLSHFLRQRTVSIADKRAAVEDAYHRIKQMFEQGIICRDLKTGNVVVGRRDGRITTRIIDFGIPLCNDDQMGLSASSFPGLAPESARHLLEAVVLIPFAVTVIKSGSMDALEGTELLAYLEAICRSPAFSAFRDLLLSYGHVAVPGQPGASVEERFWHYLSSARGAWPGVDVDGLVLRASTADAGLEEAIRELRERLCPPGTRARSLLPRQPADRPRASAARRPRAPSPSPPAHRRTTRGRQCAAPPCNLLGGGRKVKRRTLRKKLRKTRPRKTRPRKTRPRKTRPRRTRQTRKGKRRRR